MESVFQIEVENGALSDLTVAWADARTEGWRTDTTSPGLLDLTPAEAETAFALSCSRSGSGPRLLQSRGPAAVPPRQPDGERPPVDPPADLRRPPPAGLRDGVGG